jgi:hypothetical protein
VQPRSLQKKQAQHLAGLTAAQDADRLRLAARASGVAIFDWSVADDTVVWEGAIEMFPYHGDQERLKSGRTFLGWLSPESRNAIAALLENRSHRQSTFDLDLEANSAMGLVGLTFVGSRIPGSAGQTERLVGCIRTTTERQRENQRLTYLATRDELTGHLNRNSLRAELAQAIDHAKA